MYTEGNRADLRPQVGFATIVYCPRIGGALLGNTSVPICISVESTPYVYVEEGGECIECRNRTACKAQAGRAKKRLTSEEILCPQSGDIAIPIAEARAMWAGSENPQCRRCPHRKDCLPVFP